VRRGAENVGRDRRTTGKLEFKLAPEERAAKDFAAEIRRNGMKDALGYMDLFLRLSCAPELLRLELFPNAKEICESMAAFDAVASHVHSEFRQGGAIFSDPEVRLVAVGDGSSPRTAALFAHRTRWTCHSVDPQLRDKGKWQCIDRLSLHRVRVEEFRLGPCKLAVIAAVHSHARLEAAVAACSEAERLVVVAIPCCVKQHLDGRFPYSYRDAHVPSEKNEVKVWDFDPRRPEVD
jgi:hypothetical protein